MRWREVLGPIIVVGFVSLFVYMLGIMSAPDAKVELGNYVIVVDLIIGFTLIMLAWNPVMHGEGTFADNLPFRVPSYVGIPLGVALFVFFFVSGLGELLLHVNEILSPALALTVAACILGGATYLSTRPDPPVAAHEAPHASAAEPPDAPAAAAAASQPQAQL